jgi:PXA domain
VYLCGSAKDVDLIPYITTRLVDDFASHIRLYRRSLSKVIEHRKDGNYRKQNSFLIELWLLMVAVEKSLDCCSESLQDIEIPVETEC